MSWAYGGGMTASDDRETRFRAVTEAGERIDLDTINEVGLEIAEYLDSDDTAPLHHALQDLLDAPMHPEQLLNCTVAMSNVVALLVLTLGQDEASASDLVGGVVGKAAHDSGPDVFPGGPEDPAHQQVQALVRRVYGTAEATDMPGQIDGRTLVALAAYGDAAVVLADRVGLPRSVLGPAVVEAIADM